jgi:predicted RNase H-like nuclease (RuvC/YqgF family)
MLPVPRTTLYLGLALVLALAAIGYNYQRGEKYRERAEAAEASSALLVSDLQAKDATIARMKAASQELLRIVNEQSQAIESAAFQLDLYDKALNTARAKLRANEERDREIPACQAVLNLDLSVCPGHTDGLRQRASRSLSRSTGGSAPAGADADRPSAGGGL